MIDTVLQSLATGLPNLIGQFVAAAIVYAAGIAAYLRLTPYHELDLVRGGNVAAAITLAGAIIGLAIPIGMTLATSVNLVDILVRARSQRCCRRWLSAPPTALCADCRKRSSVATWPQRP